MARTHRKASVWMETRFKFGDPQYPDPQFADRRYQEKVRNGNRSYYTIKMDPLTMKKTTWSEFSQWAKAYAKRNAKRQAKIIVKAQAHLMVMEDLQDNCDLLWEDYDDEPMRFDYSWSDEAYDYAEQRRQEKLEDSYLDYGYDPYPDDWDH